MILIDSEKFQRVSEFGIITANNHRRFSKMSLRFRNFPDRMENKKALWISEIAQHFQKCFMDYDRGAQALQKKMCEAIWGLQQNVVNIVFLFQMKCVTQKNRENVENL